MLKIGWSSKDISTDKPVILHGQFHMRVSRGCLDSLNLTALVIDDGSDYAIFVQADTIFMPAGLIDEIREKVKIRNSEIDCRKIFVASTHTHCSPLLTKGDDIAWWGKLSDFAQDNIKIDPPGNYRDFFTTAAAEAVCEAYESRERGSFSYGYGYAVVAHSRRSVYTKDMSVVDMQRKGIAPDLSGKFIDTNNPNGHAKMYGSTNDEFFSHYEAGADHFANFLFTFDKDENLTGAIVNIPCPSQLSESEEYITADYWNEVRTLLKEKYGDIHIMPQCAAGGDLAPRILHYQKAQSRRFSLKYGECPHDTHLKAMSSIFARRDIAERICTAFDEVYSWAQKEKITEAKVFHTVKTIMLDRRIVTDDEYEQIKSEAEAQTDIIASCDAKPTIDTLREHTRPLAEYYRRLEVLERYEKQKETLYEKAEIHTICIGDVAFATNPFELYMDYQHRIQARSPFTQTFVVQLCAQPEGYVYSGYLATERGHINKGYSASVFCNQVSPSGGAMLVEQTLAELNKLKD